MAAIQFEVPGIPRPGGSKKGFYIRGKNGGNGHIAMTDAGGEKTKAWRELVASHAAIEMQKLGRLMNGPIRLVITFRMPRPKGHYKANGALHPVKGQRYHTSSPDATKLTRSTEDALKGIAWKDDCLVASQTVEKPYANEHLGEFPGATIRIVELDCPLERALRGTL